MSIPVGKSFLRDEEKEAVERVIYSKRLATGEIVIKLLCLMVGKVNDCGNSPTKLSTLDGME